ncbi:LysM peptidoglycan-binding domain-containing protein [Saccharopolyspora spinosporotrichia]
MRRRGHARPKVELLVRRVVRRRNRGVLSSGGVAYRATTAVLGLGGSRVRAAGGSRLAGEWMCLASVGAFTFLMVLLVGLVGPGSGMGDEPVPAGTAVVQVRTGDTLWGLAERFAPASDPRLVVDRIAQMNGLNGVTAEVGRPLVVPMERP